MTVSGLAKIAADQALGFLLGWVVVYFVQPMTTGRNLAPDFDSGRDRERDHASLPISYWINQKRPRVAAFRRKLT